MDFTNHFSNFNGEGLSLTYIKIPLGLTLRVAIIQNTFSNKYFLKIMNIKASKLQ